MSERIQANILNRFVGALLVFIGQVVPTYSTPLVIVEVCISDAVLYLYAAVIKQFCSCESCL